MERGFTSRTKRHPLEFDADLKEELTSRFNWEKIDKDDFIAVRDDEAHAIAWGERWERHHPGRNCRIATMDGAKIKMPMYRATELIRAFRYRNYNMITETFEDEYLVLHRITEVLLLRVSRA